METALWFPGYGALFAGERWPRRSAGRARCAECLADALAVELDVDGCHGTRGGLSADQRGNFSSGCNGVAIATGEDHLRGRRAGWRRAGRKPVEPPTRRLFTVRVGRFEHIPNFDESGRGPLPTADGATLGPRLARVPRRRVRQPSLGGTPPAVSSCGYPYLAPFPVRLKRGRADAQSK